LLDTDDKSTVIRTEQQLQKQDPVTGYPLRRRLYMMEVATLVTLVLVVTFYAIATQLM